MTDSSKSNPDSHKIIKVPVWKNRLFLLGLLFGIIIASVVTYTVMRYSIMTTGTDVSTWDTKACEGMPGSDRDGIRMGDDGPGTGDRAAEYLRNYESRFGPSTTTSTDGTVRVFFTGGNFHRCVLRAILNSLDEADNYVHYAFAQSGDSTFLIIQRGMINPETGVRMGQPLMYRTGTDADSYCPYNCVIR